MLDVLENKSNQDLKQLEAAELNFQAAFRTIHLTQKIVNKSGKFCFTDIKQA